EDGAGAEAPVPHALALHVPWGVLVVLLRDERLLDLARHRDGLPAAARRGRAAGAILPPSAPVPAGAAESGGTGTEGGPLFIDQFGGQLAQEARGGRRPELPPPAPGPRPGEHEDVTRPRDADIAEAPLLVEPLRTLERP